MSLRRDSEWPWVLLLAAIVVAVLGIVFLCVTMRSGEGHEDGYSVGTLINVREEGVLWSRPAATLLHTGEMKGDEYALGDGLYSTALKFADRSARVRIRYAHRYVCWAWNYASCNIITAIEPDPTAPEAKP